MSEARSCYIANLPDEILVEVFEYLPLRCSVKRRPPYEQCSPLLMVCKRWSSLYKPIFYRLIDIKFHTLEYNARVASLVRITSLYHTLEARPQLRASVRQMNIKLSGNFEEFCRIASQTIMLCQGIRQISMHMERTSSFNVLTAVSELPALEILALSGAREGLSFLTALQTCSRILSLKQLTLCHCGIPKKSSGTISSWPRRPNYDLFDSQTLPSLDEIFPPSSPTHHSNLISLNLSSLNVPPAVAMLLLKWPLRLTSLSLTNFVYAAPVAILYRSKVIQDLISLHRFTLQSVRFGNFPSLHAVQDGLDFSVFPNLEEICLIAWQFVHPPRDGLGLDREELEQQGWINAGAKLAAPRLRRLTLDFSNEGQRAPDMKALELAEVRRLKWLVEGFYRRRKDDCHHESKGSVENAFTLSAKEGMRISPSSLTKLHLHVEFTPKVRYYELEAETDEEHVWPWVYLEEVRDELLKEFGVVVTWNNQNEGSIEWEKRVRRVKGRLRNRET